MIHSDCRTASSGLATADSSAKGGPPYRSALIIGDDCQLNAATSRALIQSGLTVAVAGDRQKDIGFQAHEDVFSFAVDATDPDSVSELFEQASIAIDGPDVVLYHVTSPSDASTVDLKPNELRRAIEASTFASFLVVQQAVKRLAPRGGGMIILVVLANEDTVTPTNPAFSICKLGLRSVAQSVTSELAAYDIEVAFYVVNAGFGKENSGVDSGNARLRRVNHDDIAQTFASYISSSRAKKKSTVIV